MFPSCYVKILCLKKYREDTISCNGSNPRIIARDSSRSQKWFGYPLVSLGSDIILGSYPLPQYVEQDLNKRCKARPKTTTASKVIPYGTRILIV